MQDVTINGAAAPYRRDLRGADLAHEFLLMLDKLKPGETLIVPNSVVERIGPRHAIGTPAYPHTRWRDEANDDFRVRRDK